MGRGSCTKDSILLDIIIYALDTITYACHRYLLLTPKSSVVAADSLLIILPEHVLVLVSVVLVVLRYTLYPKKYAHGFVVLCFVVVMQSFIMNSHEVFIHIHQGCFAGTGAIVRLPQCQWSKPDGYGKISQCITTTKHSKAKTVCIFFGIYCSNTPVMDVNGLWIGSLPLRIN